MPTSPPPLFIGDLVKSRRVIYQPSSFAMHNLLYLQETGSLTDKKKNQFEPLLDLIMETASSSSYIRDKKINEELSQLLTLLMEYSWNPERAKTSNTTGLNIANVRAFIDQNFTGYQNKIHTADYQ